MSTLAYTIEMTSDVLKFSPDSSIDTNEGNEWKKDILVGKSPIQSIVSANNSLIDKGESNPHHHSIPTKDPFHTIIKNIQSNTENTDI